MFRGDLNLSSASDFHFTRAGSFGAGKLGGGGDYGRCATC